MTNEEETEVSGEEEKRIKRKLSLEASVTLGLGYGAKKKVYVKAFFSAVWPVLQGAGWMLVQGEGKDEGLTYFLPPGVTMGHEGEEHKDTPQSPSKEKPSPPIDDGPWLCASCGHTNVTAKSRCCGSFGEGLRCMAWRGGRRVRKPYFSRVRDVIERVLEKNNEAEAIAADAYTELVPHVADLFTEQTDKKEPRDSKSVPSSSSQTRQKNDLSSWKDERTHYNKSSSRIGSEFQVAMLPKAGSCPNPTNHTDAESGGALYERVWEPELAEKSGKLDFVHTRVKYNKQEAAYELLHLRCYRLPGFYQDVNGLGPDDGSDWTKEDNNRFRAAVFEHHENMIEISKALGKPINQCITHYLVRFKRTKSYKSLKRSMKRKANMSGGGTIGTLLCNECSKGGMLIACDTCEAHYHLACALPPLESIPDGTWICGNCRRETRSMLSSQDEMSCGTDQHQGSTDVSVNGGGDFSDKEICDGVVNEASLSRDDKRDAEDIALEGPGETCKRISDSRDESTPLETVSNSKQIHSSSGYKRWRPW